MTLRAADVTLTAVRVAIPILQALLTVTLVLTGLVSLDEGLLEWGHRHGVRLACAAELDAAGAAKPPSEAVVGAARACKADVALPITLGAAFLAFLVEVLAIWIPDRTAKKKLDAFRPAFMASNLGSVRAGLAAQLRVAVRINLMLIKRHGFLWRSKRFAFAYYDGFEPPYDRDLDLVLEVSQGVAGEAVAAREPRARMVDAEWVEKRGWNLRMEQRELTSHVKWILSVPILRARPNRPATVVGVINLDVLDEAAAGRLVARREVLERLSGHLSKIGALAGHLW